MISQSFKSPIIPFFYAIPAMVYSHYEISELRNEMYARIEEIEKPKKQLYVHNGFRKNYRKYFQQQ